MTVHLPYFGADLMVAVAPGNRTRSLAPSVLVVAAGVAGCTEPQTSGQVCALAEARVTR